MTHPLVVISQALQRVSGGLSPEQQVLLSFTKGKRKWRTLPGLAKTCGLTEPVAQKALGKLFHLGYVRLTLSQGLNGAPIYALSNRKVQEVEE